MCLHESPCVWTPGRGEGRQRCEHFLCIFSGFPCQDNFLQRSHRLILINLKNLKSKESASSPWAWGFLPPIYKETESKRDSMTWSGVLFSNDSSGPKLRSPSLMAWQHPRCYHRTIFLSSSHALCCPFLVVFFWKQKYHLQIRKRLPMKMPHAQTLGDLPLTSPWTLQHSRSFFPAFFSRYMTHVI